MADRLGTISACAVRVLDYAVWDIVFFLLSVMCRPELFCVPSYVIFRWCLLSYYYCVNPRVYVCTVLAFAIRDVGVYT